MGKMSAAQQQMWPWTAKKLSAAAAPSVEGILKAGDYSSSLFTQLSGHSPHERSWRPLFDAFFSKSIIGSRRRSKSRRHSAFALDTIPAENPSDDIRDISLRSGQPCVRISPEELVALSFVLGIPLTISNDEKTPTSITGSGAFGISLHSETSSGNVHQIRIRYTKPQVIQQPAPDGSYSILFAKHLACGSLPFATEHHTTHALFIDAAALSDLKAGESSIGHPTPVSSRQTDYLSRLPSSPTLFHILDPHSVPLPRPIPHRSKSAKSHKRIFSTSPRRSCSTRHTSDTLASRRVSWPSFPRRSTSSSPSTPSSPAPSSLTFPVLISTLPFNGGLTPFASLHLVTAIRFTASAGRARGNLLPLLENLIYKIHRHSPHLVDFGPYLNSRNAGAWLRTAGYVGYTPSPAETDTATGVGRVSRYVAAVKALVGMLKTSDTGAGSAEERAKWVEEACRVEMEGAYWDAVRGGEVLGKGETLGATLAEILKKPLPFDLQTIATVARLVVVAWTWQVGVVVWGESEREEVRGWKGDGAVYEAWGLEGLGRSRAMVLV